MLESRISRLSFLLVLMLGIQISLGAQLDSSNLPILIIDTERAIRDVPKTEGIIKVYSNSPTGYNSVRQTPTLEHKIGIEIRGNSSRTIYDKKGFGFEFWNQQKKGVDTTILGLPAESEWVIHSPYGDKSLIRNALIYQLGQGLFAYAPRTRLVEIILNGNYYGVCVLTERLKIDQARVAIPRLDPKDESGDAITGGYILRFDKGEGEDAIYESEFHPKAGSHRERDILLYDPAIEEINQQQFDFMSAHIEAFDRMMASPLFDDPDKGFRQWIDVESYVHFFLVNELSKDVDAYRLSSYFYKDRENNGGLLFAGPIWDFNLAFGNANYCGGESTEGWAWQFNERCDDDDLPVHFWWSRFLQDSVFSQALVNQWHELRQTRLNSERIQNCIDSLAGTLSEANERNFERWDILGRYIWPNHFIGQTHQEEIDYLSAWIMKRLEWLDENIGDIAAQASLGYNRVESVNLYPNPVRRTLNFDIETEGLNNLEIRIYSSQGQLIETKREDQPATAHTLTWEINQPQGIYMLQVLSSNTIVVQVKFAVIH